MSTGESRTHTSAGEREPRRENWFQRGGALRFYIRERQNNVRKVHWDFLSPPPRWREFSTWTILWRSWCSRSFVTPVEEEVGDLLTPLRLRLDPASSSPLFLLLRFWGVPSGHEANRECGGTAGDRARECEHPVRLRVNPAGDAHAVSHWSVEIHRPPGRALRLRLRYRKHGGLRHERPQRRRVSR